MNKKRRIALCLIFAIAVSTLFSGYTYMDGMGYVYFDSEIELNDGAVYKEQVAVHPGNGREEAFIVTADTVNGGLTPFVYTGEITGKYNMSNMIKWTESMGYRVAAGINGDLYDTASGAPKGLTISNGKIKTSGYEPEYVISFDQDGRASAAYVNLTYSLKAFIWNSEEGNSQTWTPQINYFNIPHGAANGLHLFNRQYASSTKTTKSNYVEVLVNADSASAAEPYVGGTITGTVVSVGIGTSNTAIGDNQFVLSASLSSGAAENLKKVMPNTPIEVTVTDNSEAKSLTNSYQAIGAYHLIASNGQVTTTSNSTAPRTAIGIKADGSIMLYAVDGRQSSSAGMGLQDMAKHMVAMGCVTVFNMDGGGSTMLASRSPGKDITPTVKNNPSDKAQRAVTNGLLLVYTGAGNGALSNIHIYPALTVAMPGADVQLTAYGSDNKYEPVGVSGVNYFVEGGNGSVTSSGLYTAGSEAGLVKVGASSGSVTGYTSVQIVNDVKFSLSVSTLSVSPSETKDINVTSITYGNTPALGKDSLFTWGCDESIGTIDGNGVFTAADRGGRSGNIYVSYGSETVTLPVTIGGSSSLFSDTASHWAKQYIEPLAEKGIISGMGDGRFAPDAQITRAQFLTLLASSVNGLSVSSAPAASFRDVPSNEWYCSYVNWGVSAGIASGMGDGLFAPNSPITREQMATMISNFANYTGTTLAGGASKSFTDSGSISDWSKASVDQVVGAGIMSGRTDGSFDPTGRASRAESATVIYMLTKGEKISMNSQSQPAADETGGSESTDDGSRTGDGNNSSDGSDAGDVEGLGF